MKVKRLSGVNTLDYFKVSNKNILLLGFEHNQSKQCSNCSSKLKCYDIIDYIDKNNKKLDIFYEAPINFIKNKKLKRFNVNNKITFNEIIFENYIIPMFMEHSIQSVKKLMKENNFDDNLIKKLINIGTSIINDDYDDDIIKMINKYSYDDLYDVYNLYNSSTLEFEMWYIFTKQQRNPNNKNRFHYFDFRTVKFNPTYFFPHNYAIDYNTNTKSTKFINYRKKFYKYLNNNKQQIINILEYLSNINNKLGEKMYFDLYKIFLQYYKPELKKKEFEKIINIYRKLIHKQIIKSQLNKYKMLETFDTIIKTIPNNVYLDIFDGGLLFTELYSIPRMFKKYTKNILYLGGSSHCYLVADFINIYFDIDSKLSKDNKQNINCVSLNNPHSFFI